MARLLFSTIPTTLIGMLMLIDVALNGANVIGRYFFGSPIFWAEEVMVYLSIWGVFIGIIAVAYKGEHLSMDLFSSRLKGRPRTALEILIIIVMAACCLFTAAQSWQIVKLFIQTGAVSAAVGIPKAIPHSALLIGFTLTALAAAVRIREQFKSASAPEIAEAVEIAESIKNAEGNKAIVSIKDIERHAQ
jgi:TRAP-type C4-dicarboxylate transport system permease small subunit